MPPVDYGIMLATGSAEAAWGTAGYSRPNHIAQFFFASVPFGLTGAQYIGWIRNGGGYKFWNEIYGRIGLKPFACGFSPIDEVGVFTTKINSISDLKGKKIRAVGWTAQMLNEAGAITVTTPITHTYRALTTGLIDGAQLISPNAYLKLSQTSKKFVVASFSSEQNSQIVELAVNKVSWKNASANYKSMISTACDAKLMADLASHYSTTKPDDDKTHQPSQRIVRPSPAFTADWNKIWMKLASDKSTTDSEFAKIWSSYQAYSQRLQTGTNTRNQ